MRFLIVEDELKMASLVRRGLVEEGHAADVAATGEDALWMAQAHPYDAIVLDVMLPGSTASRPAGELRKAGVWAPVLMLTARDSVGDRVAGLDAGADDYLTKPFSFAELLARLRALVRRGGVGAADGARRRRPPARPGDARRSGAATRRSALAEGVRAARDVHAPPGAGRSRRLQLLEHAWDFAYENRSNVDRRLRPLPPREGRPAVRRRSRSRRCAASATGSRDA